MLRNKDGYQMFSHEVLKEFGLPPSSPIPVDFSAQRVIDGVVVCIYPRGKAPGGVKRRVLAECPICKRMVCAGHLHQHNRTHKRG